MIKTFVLIMVIAGGTSGLTSINVEFSDETSCIKVLEDMQNNISGFINIRYAKCHPKGDK